MAWDARPELIAEIRTSIVPVRTGASLGKALAEDFPRDCADLPISGGWGYSQDDAIVFIRKLFPLPAMPDYVPLEYHIVQKIIYEELIIFRPKDYQFSGITKTLKKQSLLEIDGRKYDCLEFLISCWSDWHWNQLKQEWETNDFGLSPGFDQTAHASKREAAQVTYEEGILVRRDRCVQPNQRRFALFAVGLWGYSVDMVLIIVGRGPPISGEKLAAGPPTHLCSHALASLRYQSTSPIAVRSADRAGVGLFDLLR